MTSHLDLRLESQLGPVSDLVGWKSPFSNGGKTMGGPIQRVENLQAVCEM